MSDEIEQIETGETRQYRKLPTLAVLGAAIIVAYLPHFLIFTFYVKDFRSTNDWAVLVLSPVITLTLMIVLTFILVKRFPSMTAFDCIWFRRTWMEAILFWLLPLGIAISIICVALMTSWFELPAIKLITSSVDSDVYRNTLVLVWMAVSTVLLFPVTEEVFWRGYVQSTLLRVCHPIIALLGQAFLFGLIHFRPVMGFMETSLFGLVFGVWCYRRKTLLPVILMHIFINFTWVATQYPEWIEIGQVRDSHDYVAEFLELSKPSNYDPNDDARAEYAEASRMIAQFPKEFMELRSRYPTQWSLEDRLKVEDWIESNSEALSLLEKGARKPYYWTEYDKLHKRLTPFPRWAVEMRSLIFAIDMRAELRSARGKYREAFSDVETSYRLGRHLTASKDRISQLIGYAVRGVSLKTLRTILAHEQIDTSLLNHLQSLFEGFAQDDASGFNFTEGRLAALDCIQCTFTDDGHGSGHAARAALRMPYLADRELRSLLDTMPFFKNLNIRAWRKLDRRRTTADVHKYYDLAEKARLLSPWQYERHHGAVKIDIELLWSQNVLIRTLATPIERLLNIAARSCLDRDANIAILAALRYQADNGHPPDSLLILVSDGYLKAVPKDGYHNGPLIYRRTDNDFLLYSFGMDFDDDGGTPSKWGDGPKGGDQVFWPVSELH